MAPSAEHQHFQNPPLFVDTLYCSEEHWEEQEHEQDDVAYGEEQELIYFQNINKSKTCPPPDLVEHDLFWEDEELISLFSKEKQNLESNPCLNAGARTEAVEWILKVHSYYSFSPLTSVLAVHYFDGFVSRFHFQNEKPWMTQLVSVACLSLAAKMEETQVPLLVDFQVEETKYVFEAKTIQRMEILVLSTLQWRMNPVTPLSFLDHITRRLGLKNNLCWEFLSRCECVIVSILSDPRYMCYLPSVMATATMLHVINNVDSFLLAQYQNQLLGILDIDKALIDECSELIKELTSLQINGCKSNKRKLGSMPASPNGVIDLSFSSDSSNDSWVVASMVSSSPEPMSKKMKAQAQEKLGLPH